MSPGAELEIHVFEDPLAFRDATEPFLLEREAANNLLLGILAAMQADVAPVRLPEGYLALGRDRDGRSVASVTLWTTGWNVLLSFPDDIRFGAAAGRAMRSTGADIPGVLGPRLTAHAFADAWRGADVPIREGMSQLIYQLDRRPEVPGGGGRLRVAHPADRDLLIDWSSGFSRDALHETPTREQVSARVDWRLLGPGGTAYIWDDDGGTPVSMASATGPTPNGIRIGGVYTPPELRGRGHASNAVAALSARLMDEGRDLCFLFTDASNPTSNAIYRRIGYEQVAEVVELRFGPA